jgi:hypothetical protein
VFEISNIGDYENFHPLGGETMNIEALLYFRKKNLYVSTRQREATKIIFNYSYIYLFVY